jgi:Flp pilus assembly protein TadB
MPESRGTGLQTIFAFFLGLMVTAFVGVGVYTFYPSPERPFRDRMVSLNRQEQAIRNSKAPDALTTEDRARIQALQDELAEAQDASRAAGERWGRRTSMVLIALATLAMVISLAGGAALPVINNGLLLGGVFTMVYGVGWIIVTDSSRARFFVMTVALGITVALGYARFVRRQAPVASRDAQDRLGADGLVELEERVRSLEHRMADAASAFGRTGGQPRDT